MCVQEEQREAVCVRAARGGGGAHVRRGDKRVSPDHLGRTLLLLGPVCNV